MEEGYKSGEDCSSDSSFDDDIDDISLLPEIKRKPNRLRRRKIHIFRERSFDFNGRNMWSKTIVYTALTAVLLVSVVFISIFVKPSSSEEFQDNFSEKRSSKESGPDVPPEDNKKIYMDKHGKKFPWQEIRLPSNVVPKRYRVEIQTDLTTMKFRGHVDMHVLCENGTKFLFFHAKHMHLRDLALYKVDESTQPSKMELGEIAESTELEMFSVEVPEGLTKSSTYILYVEFNSSLAEKLFGFYKSSYKDKNGRTRHIATTHFEPTDARAAFPCMDEPALKARFEIILIREKQYTALSNMPVVKSEVVTDELTGKSFIKDYFQESVLMSTYLVAFVICDFKHLSARTKNNILVRVWAPPDHIEEARFALSEATSVLAFYEEFFKVPFPLPKQDLIAIPDFPTGAMENWGLITYRLTSMLYSPLTSSDSNKQWVSVVVAHELAHQWFGNLVTMKWWNDLWLNEGFASFMENLGASHDNPQWKMMDQFLLDKVQLAMNLDQMSNSHPISVPVHNPSEINALFDTISYDKGASIIRMLKSIIGEKAFKLGLQDYLHNHKFANAQTMDLWKKLSQAWKKVDPKVISTFMNTWTQQMGFPVIQIDRNNNQVVASQKHFLVHPNSLPTIKSKFDYKWEIALTYSTQVFKEENYIWMHKDGKKVLINLPENSGWFKANYGQKGFYRVNYDQQSWKDLTEQLNTNHKVLSDADRSGLMDDAFNLARAGQLDLPTAFGLTLYLVKEKEYVPWTTALNNMGYIHSMLCTEKASFDKMKAYLLQQLEPIVKDLGWQDEGSHLQKYLRATVLKSAVEYGHEEAKEEASKTFNEWMESGKVIPPNLRSVIYSIGVRNGGKKAFEFVLKKFQEEKVAAEKRKLMYALSSSDDVSLLQELLDKSLNPKIIRSQDTVAVINAVAGNCKGRFIAWEFVKKNWKILFERYAAGSFDFSRLVLRTTSHFNDVEKLKEVTEFFKNATLGSGERASRQSLESIEANIDWMNKNKDIAVNWMEKYTNPARERQDIVETLQDLKSLEPKMRNQEERGYAGNDYYYQEHENPRYDSDDYYRETGDNYRYEY